MPETRNQHIIPQMHLRHWSDEKAQAWVCDVVSQKIFKTNIRNICAQRDYYEMKQNIDLPYPLEEVLSEEIEGPAAEPLAKLAQGNVTDFKRQDHDSLCHYFGHQIGRTPFMHKQLDKIAIKLQHESAMKVLADEAKFQKFEKEWKAEHPNRACLTREELIDAIQGDGIVWKTKDNDHNLTTMMILGRVMAESYRSQRWTLLVATAGRQFICNDHPVVTVTGLLQYEPRTETVIPISPRACLLLDKGERFRGVSIVTAQAQMVRDVNRRIAVHTDRFLVANNEPLLLRMAKVRESDQSIVSQLQTRIPGDALEHTNFRSISRTLYPSRH